MLEVRNLHVEVGGREVLHGVSFTIPDGQTHVLLGPNGSGKTTLMNMLSGIYFPDEGQIFINGEEVSIASPKDAYTYGIGMIHQHFKLVDLFSAAENIILGLEDEKMDLKAVAAKVKACEECGFTSSLIRYEADITEAELLAKVDELNNNPEVDGFIVQLPLPRHIDSQKVIEAIDYRKDVDGFHPVNVGRLVTGQKALIPCTPHGCIRMLELADIPLDANVLDTSAVPTVVAVSAAAPADRVAALREKGVSVVVAGEEKVALPVLMDILYREFSVRNLIIEGGPTLNWHMLHHHLVDEIRLIHLPFIVGGSDTPSLVGGMHIDSEDQMIRLELSGTRMAGTNLVTEYRVL